MQVPYNLPVPFWLYAYGATGALLVSFVIVGYFVRADSTAAHFRTLDLTPGGFASAVTGPTVVSFFRGLSVFLLAFTILSGLVGSKFPTMNFNITFFWIIVVLGFTYLLFFIGDVYQALNPWLVLVEWLERSWPGMFRGGRPYPEKFSYYPALLLYMAFIWIELFARTSPRALSQILIAYTILTLVGAWLYGKQAWFRYGEFFSVFFRLIGKQAPLEYRCPGEGANRPRVLARAPFMGLLSEKAEHFSLLLFVLFMLSSTAYDGIHETVPWVTIFWKGIYPTLEKLIAVGNPRQYLVLVDYFYYWQWLMMLISPFIYLAIYLFFIWLTKLITRSPLSIGELALRFTYSLIPIAFVYNVTHYFTLLVAQGPFVVSQISDPFGFNWNLFGTKRWVTQQTLLDAGVIWHTQVGLILFGHIVSVYVAHLEALKVFPTSRQAALSQLPLLLLMVLLTTIGLWILSLPIAAGQVLLPTPAGAS